LVVHGLPGRPRRLPVCVLHFITSRFFETLGLIYLKKNALSVAKGSSKILPDIYIVFFHAMDANPQPFFASYYQAGRCI